MQNRKNTEPVAVPFEPPRIKRDALRRAAVPSSYAAPLLRKIRPLLVLLVTFGWTLSGVFAAPALPIQADHNYSLWMNINEAVLELAELTSGVPDRRATQEEMPASEVSGKTPREVLTALVAFSRKLDEARQRAGLAETVLYVDETNVTPAGVYDSTSRVLVSLAEYLVCIGGSTQLIGRFFERQRFSGMTFSDVFQAIELAMYRLDLVLDKDFQIAFGKRGCRE